MKKFFLIILLMLAFSLNAQALNYKQAKAQNKTIVLYLYMTTCGACKEFEPIYNTVSAKHSDKFNFVKENVYYSSVSEKLKPDGVPVVYLIEPKQKTARKIIYECMTNQACFEDVLNNYVQK